ncbi:response regulator transcription factor [Enterovirga aerilata]|uniref:Response regulator transcription factor n=1 Tax=Enterovirga aerilata TaxID=2730920 RepID=A0A849ICD0_9HYPH|nr:response regulator transcription factor [Enterovirga sp. DB1703]NNM74079.1 response regulator transcription factor [Enterovirga sp. DB1703]
MCRAVATCILSETTLFRDGLARILGRSSFKVVAQGSTDLVPKLQGGKAPKLFIVAFEGAAPHPPGVIEAIRCAHPDAYVVVVASHPSAEDIGRAFRSGAHGFLANSISSDGLLKSLEVVIAGGTVLPGDVSALFTSPKTEQIRALPSLVEPRVPSAAGDSPPLSSRELVILRSLVNGDSNKHIARQLEIAEATVKVHVKAILRKIRVRNRTQAAIWAMNVGLSQGSSSDDQGVERDGHRLPPSKPALISLNS